MLTQDWHNIHLGALYSSLAVLWADFADYCLSKLKSFRNRRNISFSLTACSSSVTGQTQLGRSVTSSIILHLAGCTNTHRFMISFLFYLPNLSYRLNQRALLLLVCKIKNFCFPLHFLKYNCFRRVTLKNTFSLWLQAYHHFSVPTHSKRQSALLTLGIVLDEYL